MIIIKWISQEKILKESFKQLKNDLSEIRAEIIHVEEDLSNLRKIVEKTGERTENDVKIEKKSESHESLNAETLRLFIKETIAEEMREALKANNTKAAAVFSAETAPENTNEIHFSTPKKEIMKDSLKEELLKSYERNKKNIIKQQILTEARKGSFTKISLRDIVVDQKKYCSKATFYRYLDELELERRVGWERKKGQNHIHTLEPPIDL
jgi:hypothetical protein